eukprot:848529-Prorocentrum_minimum.AAC.2
MPLRRDQAETQRPTAPRSWAPRTKRGFVSTNLPPRSNGHRPEPPEPPEPRLTRGAPAGHLRKFQEGEHGPVGELGGAAGRVRAELAHVVHGRARRVQQLR